MSTRNPPTLLREGPQIASPADLNDALDGLGFVEARIAEVDALRKQEIDIVNRRLDQQFEHRIGDQLVPLADLHAAYLTAIEGYCEEHRSAILEGDRKSREFTHGTIAWKQQPLTVEFRDGETKAKIVERLFKKHALANLIETLLEQFKLIGVLKLKAELDLQTLISEVRKGKRKEKDLPHGLKVVPEHDVLSVTASKFAGKSESASPLKAQ